MSSRQWRAQYTRYGFRKLIADRAVDVLQPDITGSAGSWSAARRRGRRRATFSWPHGSSVYGYHLSTLQQHAARRVHPASPNADKISPTAVVADEPLPENGFIDIAKLSKPGFGVTLIRDNLHRPYPRTAQESAKNAAATRKPDPPYPRASSFERTVRFREDMGGRGGVVGVRSLWRAR